MRILFVAMAHSIHTARWISQIAEQGWDIHLFPSIDVIEIHSKLPAINIHHSFYVRQSGRLFARQLGVPAVSRLLGRNLLRLLNRLWPNYHEQHLRYLIHTLKPDIVHSLEFQAAGYLTLTVRQQIGPGFPKWIATNWGSDVYLFGRLDKHREKIRSILSLCDYYSCECVRDVDLALKMGLQGEALPVTTNTGGFDLSHAQLLRQPGLTSARRLILVKGYQTWAGRSLVALRALARCGPQLQGYRIAIYSASEDVSIAAELLSQETGIMVEVLPPCSHEEMLRLFGQARIYLGLSISDAISTSLLEAMIMGAFPIQSFTSCASEWVTEGKSALLVPPDDPDVVAEAIRLAVTDDPLVDEAADINLETAKLRLDASVIRPKAIEMYNYVHTQPRKKWAASAG
jgi:glycosyltransferase involved in cell wall biosynthesis